MQCIYLTWRWCEPLFSEHFSRRAHSLSHPSWARSLLGEVKWPCLAEWQPCDKTSFDVRIPVAKKSASQKVCITEKGVVLRSQRTPWLGSLRQ